MLERDLYRGRIVWGKFRNVDRAGRTRLRQRQPDDSLIRRGAPELRIIPEELWLAVEQVRARNSHMVPQSRAPKKPGASLLSGLATCACCQGPIIVSGGSERTRTYVCGWRVNRGATICSNCVRASVPGLDCFFLDLVEEEVLSPAARRFIADHARRLLAEANRNSAAEDERLRDRIRDLELIIGGLVRAVEEATIGSDGARAIRSRSLPWPESS